MDRRATAETAGLAARFGAAELRNRTGLNVDASHGGTKIAWLRAQERAGRLGRRAYLLPVSLMVAHLTGVRVVDPAAASSTLLLELATGDWAPDLVEAAGTTRDAMATVDPRARRGHPAADGGRAPGPGSRRAGGGRHR